MSSINDSIIKKNQIVHQLGEEYKTSGSVGDIKPAKATAREYAEQKTDTTGSPGTSNSATNGNQNSKPKNGKNISLFKQRWFAVGAGVLIVGLLLYLVVFKK